MFIRRTFLNTFGEHRINKINKKSTGLFSKQKKPVPIFNTL